MILLVNHFWCIIFFLIRKGKHPIKLLLKTQGNGDFQASNINVFTFLQKSVLVLPEQPNIARLQIGKMVVPNCLGNVKYQNECDRDPVTFSQEKLNQKFY